MDGVMARQLVYLPEDLLMLQHLEEAQGLVLQVHQIHMLDLG